MDDIISYESMWANDIENVLQNVMKNSFAMAHFHTKKYFALKSYLKFFRIPCIILSACNSIFAVGLSSYLDQNLVSAINCVISLICGIIVSLELYMQIESNMREEVLSSKSYFILASEIEKMLLLDRKHRQQDGKVYCNKCFVEYCKLYENSDLIEKHNSCFIKDKPLKDMVNCAGTTLIGINGINGINDSNNSMSSLFDVNTSRKDSSSDAV